MKKILGLFTLLAAAIVLIYFVRKAKQFTNRSYNLHLTVKDYEHMKKQLGITIPNRPAPAQDPYAPNAANYDEAKVRQYVLPDPLQLKNGEQVKTPADWWEKRRPEIVEDFDREVYGRIPEDIPPVTWKIISEENIREGSYTAKQTKLLGIVKSNSYKDVTVSMELTVTLPNEVSNPVPVILKLGSGWRPLASQDSIHIPTWREQLLTKRWGYAILRPTSIQPDSGAGLREGIIGLMNQGQPRKPEDWGALRAWAWGASRAFDYLETTKEIDSKRIAIEGFSRYGKAALVAMANDSRFSLAFIGSTGVGGAKIMRRNFSEQVENVTIKENYYWFCGNFLRYASTLTTDDLPVDAHELIALCAPRPVFISCGSSYAGDIWSDPNGMFLGGVHAGPVYKLLGKKDLTTTEFPPMSTPLVHGEIAFRQHENGHTSEPNWTTWIEWADKYW